MKHKRFIAMILASSMLLMGVPVNAETSEVVPVEDVDLMPDEANLITPNYVCTWSNQDWTAMSSDAEKAVNSNIPRDMINHDQLFDPETGWCYTAYQDVKKDMIFLLDDGWDLPYGSTSGYDLILDEEKFPNYGDTPQERLKTLVDNIEAAGWKGAGVWIRCNNSGEAYWRERLEWCAYAGIDYWKIDWGNASGNDTVRRTISNLADEIAPELVIEHASLVNTLNQSSSDGTRMSDSAVASAVERGSYSDVLRTYDVNGNLSIATSFERIGRYLETAHTDGQQLGLLNGEDEVYMCSALGLMFGVMRYDIGGASCGSLPNIFFGGDESFAGTRPIRKMLDEVQRAVKWQRIAPAYRVDAYDTELSKEVLADSWIYSQEDTWDTGSCKSGTGTVITQKSPAAVARGINLPVVEADANGIKPFVAASRNPNGAISIGAMGRTTPSDGYQVIYSDISLNVGDLTGKIGVFGYYDSLTLTFNQDLRYKEIYAQDMMDTEAAWNITDQAVISEDGRSVTFDGELLSSIGLSGAIEEYSEPGLVIQIGEEDDFAKAPEINKTPDTVSIGVNNPSFEIGSSKNGDAPFGWDTWAAEGYEVNRFCYVEANENWYGGAHTGTWYGASWGKEYECATTQTITVPNGTYTVSAWVQNTAFTGTAYEDIGCAGYFGVKGYGGETRFVALDEERLAWTKLTIEDVEVTTGKIELGMYLNNDTGTIQWAKYDDFAVEPAVIDPEHYVSATTGDYEANGGKEGDAPFAVDDDLSTKWHTDWYVGENHDKHWIQVELDGIYLVNGFRYLPRQDDSPNGRITKYEIFVSMDGENWTSAATGSWSTDNDWKDAYFDQALKAKYVRLQTIEATSDQDIVFASATEIRVMGELVPDCVEHTTELQDKVDATCTEDGHTGKLICTTCGIVVDSGEVVKATGHAWGEVVVTKATCTEDGSSVKTCEACGEEVVEVIEATGHDWGEWVVIKEAAPGVDGTEERSCANCDAKEERKIEKLPEEKPTNPFKDVFENQYYYEPVMWAVEKKITSGLSADIFGSEMPCTREQIVTFLWNYAGKPEAAIDTCTFKDVKSTHYYYNAMLWAVEHGYVSGYDTDTFGVGDPCTREQIVMILWKFAESPDTETTDCSFKDVNRTHYYYDAMLWAVKHGIVSGYDADTFGVGDTCTRGQIVTFLYRYEHDEA